MTKELCHGIEAHKDDYKEGWGYQLIGERVTKERMIEEVPELGIGGSDALGECLGNSDDV